MTRTDSHSALAHEPHFVAAVEVARCALQGETRREALLEVAARHTGASTAEGRRRAAAAILGWLGLGRRRQVATGPVHELLAALPERAGRRLWLYLVAAAEPMLAAVAREVLYPYFVECRPPEGFTAEEFSTLNANGLFEVAGALTHAGVAAYARRHWGLRDPAPTGRALRALRKGGVLEATRLHSAGGPCLGYFPAGGPPDLACLAYVLYAARDQASYIRWDRLRAGLFAHLFLLRPIAMDWLLNEAMARGLVNRPAAGLADLPLASLEAAVAAILKAHRAGGTNGG